MTPERLSEIRARLSALEDLPWHEATVGSVGNERFWILNCDDDPILETVWGSESLDSFIINAPDDIRDLLAALAVERQRAVQAERDRDELRAIMKEGHTRKACVGREPVYSMRCSACRARSRAEAAERKVAALSKPAIRFIECLNFNIRDFLPEWAYEDVCTLRTDFARALEATAPPDPLLAESGREE